MNSRQRLTDSKTGVRRGVRLEPSPPNLLLHTQLGLEARVGIEPTHKAFAEPRLTTWLPRHPRAVETKPP